MALRLTVAPTVAVVTTADVKTHLRESLSDAGNDAYIAALVGVATQAAEHRLGRSLMKQTWELTLDCFPPAIRLDNAPILGVTSVEYRQDDEDGDYVVLSAAAYTVDSASEPGYIVPAYGYTWPTPRSEINAVRVTYTAGYSASATAATAQAAVPLAIRQWILLAVGDMYAQRAASNARPAVRHDFVDGLLDRYRIWGI